MVDYCPEPSVSALNLGECLLMRHKRWIMAAAGVPAAALLAGSVALAGGGATTASPAPAAPAAPADRSVTQGIADQLDVVLASAVLAPVAGDEATSYGLAAPAAAVPVVRTAKTPFPGLSATQIKNRSAVVAARASSLHVAGYAVSQRVKIGFDLAIGKTAASGTISLPQGSCAVRRIGNVLYIRVDDKLAASYGAAAGTLSTKWIKVTRTDPNYKKIAPITTIASWSAVVKKLNVTSRKPGATFGGTPTVALVQPGRHGGVLNVATAGPAFPRYVTTKDKSARFAMYGWNAAVTVEAPPADSIVTVPGR